MRARFTCLQPWAWLTIIILTESVLLAAWLSREYFVFDYSCFMVQINSELKSEHSQKIHIIMEMPEEKQDQTRLLQERSTNSTNNFGNRTRLSPTHGSKIRKKKRPLRNRAINTRRNIESVVRIEPLLSLYSDKDEQVPFKTKTTWNKFHKQMPPRSQQNGTRRRRKKKRPTDMSRRQALSKHPTPALNLHILTTTQPTIEFTMNSTNWNFDEPQKTSTMEVPIQFIDTKCTSCKEKLEAAEKSTSFENQASRWRTHGVGGPSTLSDAPVGLNFTEQLEGFASNAICIGRTMADFWSIGQILAALPFLLGIQLKARCLFTPFLVLSALFLVVLFVYAATLTIFSLVLFMLVDEMKLEILLDWMLFAAILDAIFVFSSLIFALTLQNCDALLIEYQQERQIVELPDSILIDPDTIEQEDGRKKQRSKSLLYSQLAVDDFMNGGNN